jgi:hypothetical protein
MSDGGMSELPMDVVQSSKKPSPILRTDLAYSKDSKSTLKEGKEEVLALNTLILTDPDYPRFVDDLRTHEIISREVEDGAIKDVTFAKETIATLPLSYAQDAENFFISEHNGNPDIVLLPVPSKMILDHGRQRDLYAKLIGDWNELPQDKKPIVIFYTNGFEAPLYVKYDCQGFLFSSDLEDLKEVLDLANKLNRVRKAEIYDPTTLAPGQKEAYDNSDLREWENETICAGILLPPSQLLYYLGGVTIP